MTTERSRPVLVAALLFLGLAIADLYWALTSQPPDPVSSAIDLANYALQVVPSFVSILLPAILLLRHPDAPSRAPVLLFGTILLAVDQGLVILNGQLQDFFSTLTPASSDLPFLVPSATIFNILVSLTMAFAVGYLANGLAHARRHEDAGATLTAAFVPVAAVFATIVGVVSVGQIDFGATSMSPTLIGYLGISVALGILRISVWAYLAATAARGWAAGERPWSGWVLATGAALLIVLALAMVNLGGVLPMSDPAIYQTYGYVIVGAYGLGHLALLAAFAVGLPAFDDGGRRGRRGRR